MDAVRPLTVRLRSSARLARVLALAHLAAAGAVATTGAPGWVIILAALALLAQGTACVARVALRRAGNPVVALRAGYPDRLPFQTRDGAWHSGRLLGTSFVAPHLTVLNIEDPARRRARHVVILPDAIDVEDYRRLRVWLRWAHPAGSDGA